MNPQLRNFLWTAAVCTAAILLGARIAEGAYTWPALAALGIVTTIMVRLFRLPADTIFLGFLLLGYIVGNRGFAQLTPVAGIPLFPAEAVLLVALAWRLVIWSFEGQLPYRRDALNVMVLLWLLIGTVRVAFDVPRFGILAARDYAMTYYALFFFIAQHMGRDPKAQRYLRGSLLAAVLIVVPVYVLFNLFQPFFLRQLTVLGNPLIYYKGDLVVTFIALGSVLIFHWAPDRQRMWAWPLSATLILFVLSNDNRASLLALMAASLLLLAGRRWRFPAMQASLSVVALAAVIALAVLFGNSWADRKLHSLTERIRSIADVSGTGSYESEESFNKGDNNRFRLVWWKNVVEETWATNPLFGLGFGADLTQGFLQEYYPDNNEEFGVRSPHNIAVTAFGRLGMTGLLVWLLLCGAIVWRSYLGVRWSDDPVTWSMWCSACAILCSSHFGVVLEGPMGAVVFWTLLGLANVESAVSVSAPTAQLDASLPVSIERALP